MSGIARRRALLYTVYPVHAVPFGEEMSEAEQDP